MWPWNLLDDLENQYGISSILCQDVCFISKPSVNCNWSYFLETLNLGRNWRLLSPVTLKFDRWPWKTIWRHFFATSSLVHHLLVIGEFKLELQSRNDQFYVKINDFCAVRPWNMTDDLEKTLRYPSYATSSFVHHFIVIREVNLELRSGNGFIGSWPQWPWPLTSDLYLLHRHHFCQG